MHADEYERKFMGADDAIAVSRARLGFVWHLFFVLTIVMSLAAIGLSTLAPGLHRVAWAGGFTALLMAATWLTAMVVRVIVTPEEVRIQHGLFGPTIAMADVVSVHAERHGLKRFLLGVGWAFGGKSFDGSYLYSTLGVPRGLVIRYRTANGIAEAFVSSNDPEALVSAIESARAPKLVRIAQQEHSRIDVDASSDLTDVDADVSSKRRAC